jgi:hypothetical protein
MIILIDTKRKTIPFFLLVIYYYSYEMPMDPSTIINRSFLARSTLKEIMKDVPRPADPATLKAQV